MMKLILTTLLALGACVAPVCVVAQVSLDKPLLFVGATDIDRRITGLPRSLNASDALSAGVEQDATLRTAFPTSGSTWQMELTALTSAPPPGTNLITMAPGGAGPIQVEVNGFGPYPLLLGPGEQLDAADVLPGTPLNIVFDGSAFHITNGASTRRKPCPQGMVTVNEEFCISPQENTTATFFEAAVVCGSQGMRLCGWAEYIAACNTAAQLGITGLTGNWEWIDDAVNEDGSVRVSGSSACSATGDALATSPRTYRCCRSR